MALDSVVNRAGGESQLHPMRIAHNPLFTAREKIDLLHQLKAEVTGEDDNLHNLGFSAEEIDEAIAEVKRGVQDGQGAQTVFTGDN